MKIYTTRGLIDRDQLTVQDVISDEQNARVTATEWRMGDELVRRDVHVNILAPQALGAEQGGVNG